MRRPGGRREGHPCAGSARRGRKRRSANRPRAILAWAERPGGSARTPNATDPTRRQRNTRLAAASRSAETGTGRQWPEMDDRLDMLRVSVSKRPTSLLEAACFSAWLVALKAIIASPGHVSQRFHGSFEGFCCTRMGLWESVNSVRHQICGVTCPDVAYCGVAAWKSPHTPTCLRQMKTHSETCCRRYVGGEG